MGLLNQLVKEKSDKSSGSKKGALSGVTQVYTENKKLVKTSIYLSL
mgnify:CR=1 FL=1